MKTTKTMFTLLLGISLIVALSVFFFMRKSLGYTTEDGVMVYKYVNNVTWKKERRILENADPTTFISFGFSGIYGKDKNHVYLEGYLVSGADPSSFKLLEDLHQYAKDDRHLYAGIKKIGDYPDSFEYLGAGFAKDKIHAFKQGNIIPDADGSTFELMDEKGHWAKDHQHVFSFGKLMEGSHSATFHHLEHNFYADKNQVYHGSRKIENVHPADFKILGDRYAKNAIYVFYEHKIIEGADSHSFELVSNGERDFYAKDKNHKYNYGKQIDRFPERLKMAEF